MTDQWDEKIRCPLCRNTGSVSLSQFNNARTPTVHLITAGFKVVQTEFGPNFQCEACELLAEE